jgi:hypothetical protein
MIDIEWVAANAITRDANNVGRLLGNAIHADSGLSFDELASKRTKVAAPRLVATNVR